MNFIDELKEYLRSKTKEEVLNDWEESRIESDVVEPKGAFICTICNEDMEEGEQCGFEEMSCPNYTGK
jgi:hypothetical protein